MQGLLKHKHKKSISYNQIFGCTLFISTYFNLNRLQIKINNPAAARKKIKYAKWLKKYA